MKKHINLQINQDLSIKVASSIVETFKGFPVEESLSVINGMAVALASFVNDVARNIQNKGAIEERTLFFFTQADRVFQTQFSQFINLPKGGEQ